MKQTLILLTEKEANQDLSRAIQTNKKKTTTTYLETWSHKSIQQKDWNFLQEFPQIQKKGFQQKKNLSKNITLLTKFKYKELGLKRLVIKWGFRKKLKEKIEYSS